eukprot:4049765-Pyramimonas_sp.AAC.1
MSYTQWGADLLEKAYRHWTRAPATRRDYSETYGDIDPLTRTNSRTAPRRARPCKWATRSMASYDETYARAAESTARGSLTPLRRQGCSTIS